MKFTGLINFYQNNNFPLIHYITDMNDKSTQNKTLCTKHNLYLHLNKVMVAFISNNKKSISVISFHVSACVRMLTTHTSRLLID